MTTPARIQTIPFPTQDYRSRVYGDRRIDCYVSVPSMGVTSSTGLLLMLHGRGANGQVSLEAESLDLSDRFDLVVTRVEYRQSGRESADGGDTGSFDKPYDYSKLQVVDCLRAARTTLDRYPEIDRRRLILWGGSQGGHIGGLCLIYAPDLWSAAMLCSGPSRLFSSINKQEEGFAWDLRGYGGQTLWELTRDPADQHVPEHEFDIRNLLLHAARFPDGVPVALIHGTHDDIVDIRHATELTAKLRMLGKRADLVPIYRGNHLLNTAPAQDENSRVKACVKYTPHLFTHRRPESGRWPRETVIPVTGGTYRVTFGHEGATLQFEAMESTRA
ncbi:MAG: alpha/beta fold hydrolase [Thermomicrobiales bacterium]|nr:alpha/beta fold hydrolase [Thermomicrobiales bacterium]